EATPRPDRLTAFPTRRSSDLQTITIGDNIDPTASNPLPVTVQCIGDVPAPDVAVVTDEADNCTTAPVVAWVSDVSDNGSCPEIIDRKCTRPNYSHVKISYADF